LNVLLCQLLQKTAGAAMTNIAAVGLWMMGLQAGPVLRCGGAFVGGSRCAARVSHQQWC
jgi:hypothetical protein